MSFKEIQKMIGQEEATEVVANENVKENDTMNEIKIFESEQFGALRCTIIDGKEYVVAKDVAVALGYANPERAIRDKVKDKNKVVTEMVTSFGVKDTTFINEAGIYQLIFSSKLPAAEQFQDWVFEVVLPSIRQTGGYMDNDLITRYANGDIDAVRQVAIVSSQLAAKLADENERLKPDAEYTRQVLQAPDLLTSTSISKDFDWTAQRLNNWLVERGVIYKRGTQYFTTKPYEGLGLMCSSTYLTPAGNAVRISKWTQAGAKFVYDMMIAEGHTPIGTK